MRIANPLLGCLCLLWTGCAVPPRMTLCYQTPSRPGDTVWWVARDDAGLRGPIVGIEHRLNGRRSRQIVFCDRGVRTFEYQAYRWTRSGPPLAGAEAEFDVDFVRAALWHYHHNPVAGDDAMPRILRETIDGIESADDIAELLDAHWTAARVKPTLGLTYRQIETELEHFPHGAGELSAASEAF